MCFLECLAKTKRLHHVIAPKADNGHLWVLECEGRPGDPHSGVLTFNARTFEELLRVAQGITSCP